MRAWDEYDAYLFDIDGTLLNCHDAVHYFAFCEALQTLSGMPLDLAGIVTHGNTDVGILRDALSRGGVAEAEWRPGLQVALDGMSRFVAEREEDLCAEPIPGIEEILKYLHERSAALGVATGNLEKIGWLKLKRAGLAHWFHFGGFSDRFEYRRDVFRAALEQARERAGNAALVCVVGDTPLDVQAAHDNGLDVIAVATGTFAFEQLAAAQPTRCVHSLTELLQARV